MQVQIPTPALNSPNVSPAWRTKCPSTKMTLRGPSPRWRDFWRSSGRWRTKRTTRRKRSTSWRGKRAVTTKRTDPLSPANLNQYDTSKAIFTCEIDPLTLDWFPLCCPCSTQFKLQTVGDNGTLPCRSNPLVFPSSHPFLSPFSSQFLFPFGFISSAITLLFLFLSFYIITCVYA